MTRSILWFGWLGFGAALTVRPLLWHIDYFNSPGPQFHRLALFFFPALVLSSALYAMVRRRSLWRYEPAILCLGVLAACLAYEPTATLVTAVIFLSTYCTGRFLSRLLGLDIRDPLGTILLSSAFGLGALICVLFVLGVLKLYYPPVFAIVLALPPLFFHRDAEGFLPTVRRVFEKWSSAEELRHPMVGVTVVFAVILLASATMVVLAPSVAFDVLRTHLVAVRYYVAQHALEPVPAVDYSYYPQGIEVLMTLGFTLAGQAAAQMIAGLFFPLFILFAFRLARDCAAPPAAAVVGSLLAAGIPFLHWTGSVAKNDLGMVFFQAAALFCYLQWSKDGNFRWIQAGVFFLAMSFGVKHVALFGAIPIGLLYLKPLWRQPRKAPAAVSLFAIFCIFGLFWPARTYLLTGHPLYPQGFGAGAHAAVSDHGQSGLSAVLRYAGIPWQVHFNGLKAFESPSANPLGIFLVVFLPVWVLTSPAPRNTAVRDCLIFCAIYLAYWSTVLITLRYAILPIAILFLFTAARMRIFYEMSSMAVRVSILGGIIYCLLFAACGIIIAEINAPQLAFFSGRLDKAGYLRQALITYPPLEFLQKHASRNERIFSVEDFSTAYAPDPAIFQCELCGTAGSCTGSDVLKEIAKGNYSYLILPDKAVYRSVEESLKGARMFDNGQYAVYGLKSKR